MVLFSRFGLQTKLFVYYSILVFIIFALSTASFYYYISSILEKRASENLAQLASRTSGQVDAVLLEMDRIALYVVSNPLIKEVFSNMVKPESRSNYFDDSIDENRKVLDTLISINVPNDISTVRTSLYNIRGDYISMGIPDSPNAVRKITESASYMGWYEAMATKGGRLLFPPHEDYWSGDKNTRMLSLTREMIDLNTYASNGVVEVQLPYDKLKDLLAPPASSRTHTYLLSDTKDLVYPLGSETEKKIAESFMEDAWKYRTGVLKMKNPVTEKMELAVFYKSAYSGWMLIQSEEEDILLAPVRITGLLLVLTGLVFLIITFIVIYIVTRRLTKPLEMLRNSVKEVSLDNLSLGISLSDSNNEVVELNKAFSAMFSRLKSSMEELVQTRSNEVKAHMIALQSQMDPHFLFNMLSVLSASSRETGDSKVTDICRRLSGMLRYTTSYNEDFVPIRDEITHAESYLTLMKIRYEDQFDYKIIIDEEAFNLKLNIPKLTLQPLVENCFKHAFKKVLPPWHIEISAGCLQNSWFIEVADNGSGIEEEQILQLLAQMDAFIKNPSSNIKDMKMGGMGLINTLVRLKLLYKDKMVLDIHSSDNGGTKIRIGGSYEDNGNGC